MMKEYELKRLLKQLAGVREEAVLVTEDTKALIMGEFFWDYWRVLLSKWSVIFLS